MEIFSITNNSFENTLGGSVMLREGNFTFTQNTISLMSQENYPFMKIENNQGLILSGNFFFNSKIARAVQLYHNFFMSSEPALVSSNTFYNITGSSDGIGLSLLSSPHVIIQNNQFNQISFLELNGASEAGGVFIDQISTNVTVDSNTFTQCRADIGGAVSYKNSFVSFFTNTYSENEGRIYGQNVAAFPVALELRSYTELPQIYKDDFPRLLVQRELQSFQSVRSGGVIDDFYLVLVDQNREVVTSSIGHTLTISVQNIERAAYIPKSQSLTQIQEKYGVYDLRGVTFSGEPGSLAKLSFYSNGINPSLTGLSSYSYQIELQFRTCLSGEEYTDDGRCIPCSAGFYSFQAPLTVSSCQKCPANADCFGGTMIAPQPGYWRSSNSSFNFINCYISNACMGSSQSDFNPQGKCYQGYSGILCAQCQAGYVRDAKFQCAKCPEQWKNILLLSVITLIAFGVFIVLIRATLQSMSNQQSLLSVYFKILANHFQLVLLTISFQLDWPGQVQLFFDITQPVVDVAARVISLDCFLDTSKFFSQHSANQGIKNIYVYLLVYLLLPFLAVGMSLLFWFLYFRSNKRRALNRAITTIIILFFFLHPSLAKNVFNIFQCRNIDGVSRLVQDLDIECYKGQHLIWAVIGGGLGLLCWVLGIPWLGWTLLRQHKTRLRNQQVMQRYGFLFKGYKQHTYYWESVVMLRKVAMIFIAVFLRSMGTRIQSLVVFVLLVFFVIVTEEKQPYLTRKLNTLELISLVTSCVTIYSGFVFLSATDSSSPDFDTNKDYSLSSEGKWLFFLIILLSNLFFLLFWTLSLVNEMRGYFRSRYPRFYLRFCLCNRSFLLEQEKKYQKAFEVNERLIQMVDNNISIMKKARHFIVKRKMFEDWNKFIQIAQFQSIQLNKLNFDIPLHFDNIFSSNRNKRAKKQEFNRTDSKLDVSAEVDFDFSSISFKNQQCQIEFQEVDDLASLGQSHMSSGAGLKERKRKYQKTHYDSRASSISSVASLATLHSQKFTHPTSPQERGSPIHSENEEHLRGGKQASSNNKTRNERLNLRSSSYYHKKNPSQFALRAPQIAPINKSYTQIEDDTEQNQSILEFFESKEEQSFPSFQFEARPSLKKFSRASTTRKSKKTSRRSQRVSGKYEIKKPRPFSKAESGLSRPQLSEHGRDLGQGIMHNIELPLERERQLQEQKQQESELKNLDKGIQEQGEMELNQRSVNNLSIQERGIDQRVNRISVQSSFKKQSIGEKEEMNLFDSFMNALDDSPH